MSCYRLKVTCDDAHLHYIHPYQFIDSPEWEAFHESSADIFQVRFFLSFNFLKEEKKVKLILATVKVDIHTNTKPYYNQ